MEKAILVDLANKPELAPGEIFGDRKACFRKFLLGLTGNRLAQDPVYAFEKCILSQYFQFYLPARLDLFFELGHQLLKPVFMADKLGLTLIEFEKHPDLGEQDLRDEGLGDKIHRSSLIAPEHVGIIGIDRGQKYDGNTPGPFIASQQVGQLVAVHYRHLHVEDRQGEVVV